MYKKELHHLQRQLVCAMPTDEFDRLTTTELTNLKLIHTMSEDVSELIRASAYLFFKKRQVVIVKHFI